MFNFSSPMVSQDTIQKLETLPFESFIILTKTEGEKELMAKKLQL